mgnify:CR=1 FL=1
MKTTSITAAWLQRISPVITLASGLVLVLATSLPAKLRAQEPAPVAVQSVSSSIQGGG